MIKLGIAEDSKQFREAIKRLIHTEKDIEIFLEAVNGCDLLEKLGRVEPDIILMDIRMPLMNGIEASLILRKRYPSIKATGTSGQFARKLGISRSMLMENLREMKNLGAAICFCPHRRTYFYTSEFGLLIGNVTKQKIKGGSDFWSSLPTRNIFIQSNGIGHLTDTLASPSW